MEKQPDPNWFWLTVSGVGPNGSGPEAGQCARIIGPTSGQRFPADPDRRRIGSGFFTKMYTICENIKTVKKAGN